ncbi:CueP family metal-binding protein [Brevibacterium paucivorans]|uniref:CueP family metal-binding protein n=1 Tax=Brevibacterium paucivorans TaxID=170994 RepID=UPI003219D7BE
MSRSHPISPPPTTASTTASRPAWGELDNEDIQVTITDEATGEVLVDEATTTFDNGFIGFWLPNDATGLIEVSYQGRTGTTEFSTTDDGATCVTDLRLT